MYTGYISLKYLSGCLIWALQGSMRSRLVSGNGSVSSHLGHAGQASLSGSTTQNLRKMETGSDRSWMRAAPRLPTVSAAPIWNRGDAPGCQEEGKGWVLQMHAITCLLACKCPEPAQQPLSDDNPGTKRSGPFLFSVSLFMVPGVHNQL